MLDPASWLAQAQQLDMGRSRRVKHDCGDGLTLKIERNEDGWRSWCFRCQDSGWVPIPAPTLAERLARFERMRVQDGRIGIGLDGNRVVLPVPQVRDVSEWPDGAALWFYKAGLSRADIGRLGAYYHPPSDRVVLPFLDPSTGPFYQARAFQPGRAPKYLGPTPRPPALIVKYGTAERATLTEDMLSAYKVGLVAEGWAVLGTSISDGMVAALLKRGQPVNVFTDPDAAGRRAAGKFCRQLQAYGLEARNVLADRDPKLLTRGQLKELLA